MISHASWRSWRITCFSDGQEGLVINAVSIEGIGSRTTADTLNSVSSVHTGQADSVGWIEGGTVGAHINADTCRGLVLVGGAGCVEDALTIDVSVAGLAGLAKTSVVNNKAIVRSLVAYSLNSDLISLADSVVSHASASVIENVASEALNTIFVHKVVSLAVELSVNTLAKAQSLSLSTAS